MTIEAIAGTGVFGMLAVAFIYTLRRTKDADERRDEGSDMVRAGLEAELARCNTASAAQRVHYETVIAQNEAKYDRQLAHEREQHAKEIAWMQTIINRLQNDEAETP